MIYRYKEKTIERPELENCTATFIKQQLEKAQEEKMNIIHFSFGTTSKVIFDVLVYRNQKGGENNAISKE